MRWAARTRPPPFLALPHSRPRPQSRGWSRPARPARPLATPPLPILARLGAWLGGTPSQGAPWPGSTGLPTPVLGSWHSSHCAALRTVGSCRALPALPRRRGLARLARGLRHSSVGPPPGTGGGRAALAPPSTAPACHRAVRGCTEPAAARPQRLRPGHPAGRRPTAAPPLPNTPPLSHVTAQA